MRKYQELKPEDWLTQVILGKIFVVLSNKSIPVSRVSLLSPKHKATWEEKTMVPEHLILPLHSRKCSIILKSQQLWKTKQIFYSYGSYSYE